jgi:hypothetical protein
MPIRRLRIVSLFCLGIAIAAAQQSQRYAVLPQTEAKSLVGLRLLNSPPRKITGTWEPTQIDVDGLEANLRQVSVLSRQWKSAQWYVDHPERYFRQYLGVLSGGRKLIYVNALCGHLNGSQPPSYWRDHYVRVSDGGNCFWNVVYDTSTRTFVDLLVNGH